MSRTVIFGITGYAGGATASELLHRGHDVAGVARNPGEVTADEHLEVRSGSVHDSAFLTEVAAGADAIVLAFADEIEKPAHHQARFTLGY
jgi:putative NADH-flavin reductase